MTIQRMDHVGVVVDDLAAAVAFFVELGLKVQDEGSGSVEGRWVDRVVGLEGVRVDVVFVQTPDGHGRLELTKFHAPTAVSLSRLHRTRSAFAASARGDEADDCFGHKAVAPPTAAWRYRSAAQGGIWSLARRAAGAVRGRARR